MGVAASSSSQIKAKTPKPQNSSTCPQRSRLRGRGLQCPHGRLPEVHGGVEGGGGLSLRSLLAVEPQCKYSSQMFALGSPTSANIHPDFLCIYRSSICYIHADN